MENCKFIDDMMIYFFKQDDFSYQSVSLQEGIPPFPVIFPFIFH
jgi:hypothetical protein